MMLFSSRHSGVRVWLFSHKKAKKEKRHSEEVGKAQSNDTQFTKGGVKLSRVTRIFEEEKRVTASP